MIFNNVWADALILSAIVFLLNLPQTYKYTNDLYVKLAGAGKSLMVGGVPKVSLVFLHALVFFVLVLILAALAKNWKSDKSD